MAKTKSVFEFNKVNTENNKINTPKSMSWIRFAVFDFAVVVCSLIFSFLVLRKNSMQISTMAILVFSFLPWFVRDRLYVSRFITRRADEMKRIFTALSKTFATIIVLTYLTRLTVDRGMLLLFFAASFTLISFEREIVRAWFKRKRRAGSIRRNIILIGENEEASSIKEMILTHKYLGYHIAGSVNPINFSDPNQLTTNVLREIRSKEVDGVIIAASAMNMGSSNRLIRDLVEARVHVELSSTLADIAPERLTVRTLGKFPVIYIEPRHRHGWRQIAKRVFDLITSLCVLIILSPLMIVISLAIKFSSSGSILFKQKRVGQNGEQFNVLKFRTMVVDAENRLKDIEENEGAGPLFKLKDDPRVTKIGRFLRKTSLDELPQLINVLRNDMSLVGPRPALKSEMSEWSFDLYARLRVKPGITGMWQVSGRSGTSFEQYTRLDLYYVDNWSLFIDISILLKTIPAVIKSDGAY